MTVLPPVQAQSVNIYNSAGELVERLDTSSLGSNVTLTALGFANAGQSAFVLPQDPAGPGGVALALQGVSGTGGTVTLPYTWNGRNSQGQEVSPGSYTVQLVDQMPGGDTIISSKGFTVLEPSDNDEKPKVSVVPNPLGPSDKQLVFIYSSLPAEDSTVLKLYNLAGELVAQGMGGGGSNAKITLQVGNWSAGIYIAVFEVRQGGGLRSRQQVRLAIQR